MSDRREEILNQEHWKVVVADGIQSINTKHFPLAYRDAAIRAMDEYFTERALELLEYVAKNISRIDRNGDFIGYRGDVFTKEQLFENFL